jgi:glucosamine--fructose-6-phosphate aminotransferase (isomerizing)
MPSLLAQEIASQPTTIAHLLDRETRHIQDIVAQLPPFDYALIAARGSSDHAATYAQYVWGTLAGYPVALAAPSLLTLYHSSIRLSNALVVGISQSGQSPDIVAVLAEGKRQGRPTLAITNDPTSPLATTADHVIELHTGPEKSVAATKTYTAQLAVMALLAASLSGRKDALETIQQLPATLEATLHLGTSIAQDIAPYHNMDRCITLGRGYNYATSIELALKLEELTYVMANAYSSADFRHGPIATVEPGMPVFLIMPSGAAFADLLELAQDLHKRGARLLVISDSPQALALAHTAFPLPTNIPEWLSPLVTILPGQLASLHLAQARGFDPDIPRGLHKITRTL